MMSELNREAVGFALLGYMDARNEEIAELLRDDEDLIELELSTEEVDIFINDYEDYERNSWLTTQE